MYRKSGQKPHLRRCIAPSSSLYNHHNTPLSPSRARATQSAMPASPMRNARKSPAAAAARRLAASPSPIRKSPRARKQFDPTASFDGTRYLYSRPPTAVPAKAKSLQPAKKARASSAQLQLSQLLGAGWLWCSGLASSIAALVPSLRSSKPAPKRKAAAGKKKKAAAAAARCVLIAVLSQTRLAAAAAAAQCSHSNQKLMIEL